MNLSSWRDAVPNRSLQEAHVVRILLIILVVIAVVAVGAALWWRSAVQGVDPAALEARYMTPADRFVDVAGARVRVREEGPADGPPLVLVHGFSVSLESWDGWAAALSDEYRVVRYDLLGHGLTGPDPQERYAPVARAEFLAELLDALGLERVNLAGNSLGGLVAWRFAALYPERVERLVLVDPGVYSINGVTDEPAPVPAAMAAFLRLAPEAGVRQGIEFVYADDAKVTDARVAIMRDMMRRRGVGDALVAHLKVFTLPDPEPDLARITAPTLILWGAQDIIIPPAQAEDMARAIPNARVILYDDLGHAPQEEDPERSARDARAFLAAGEGA